MSCSGLRPAEMRCLVHALSANNVPKQAEPFLKSLQAKLGRKPPAPAEVAAMCTPPKGMEDLCPHPSPPYPPA
eukprot:4921462-Pleurochrysis_carterae.AAC.2